MLFFFYLCVSLEHAPVEVVGDLPAVLHLRHHVLERWPTEKARVGRGKWLDVGALYCFLFSHSNVFARCWPISSFSCSTCLIGEQGLSYTLMNRMTLLQEVAHAPDGPVVEMLLQEENAGREIAVVVLVRDTPPKGTKLSSLLHLTMNEHANRTPPSSWCFPDLGCQSLTLDAKQQLVFW